MKKVARLVKSSNTTEEQLIGLHSHTHPSCLRQDDKWRVEAGLCFDTRSWFAREEDAT